MTYGLSSENFELLEKLLLQPLKKEGAQVWIFGSRARGDQRKFSDIDILFELPKGKELPLELLGRVKENLEESNLPYKVDIVNSSELAESYRQNIYNDRIHL